MAMCEVLYKGNKCLQLFRNCSISHTVRRTLSLSQSYLKYDKETVDAIVQFDKENNAIYGPRLVTSRNSEGHILVKAKLPKRKRGRPKKIKSENEYNSLSTSQTTTTSTQTEHNVLSHVDNAQKSLDNIDIELSKSNSAPSQPDINGIPLYPLFPPDRREFYVNPPDVPDIYIPGHTERAAFTNPFYPSVGTILSATQPVESRMALKKWRDRLVEELGEEGFNKHKKEIIDRGVEFHACIQQILEGADRSEVKVSSHNEGYWTSAASALGDVTDVQAVEKTVLHRQLCYKGQYDCIARYRDQKVLIDWKTSKKTKADIKYTYDNPLQVVAYVGANNFSDNCSMIDCALIVVCYEDGQPAHTHLMSRAQLVDYWSKWLWRLHQYWTEKLQLKTNET